MLVFGEKSFEKLSLRDSLGDVTAGLDIEGGCFCDKPFVFFFVFVGDSDKEKRFFFFLFSFVVLLLLVVELGGACSMLLGIESIRILCVRIRSRLLDLLLLVLFIGCFVITVTPARSRCEFASRQSPSW